MVKTRTKRFLASLLCVVVTISATNNIAFAQEATFDPESMGLSGQGNIASWKEKNKDVMAWLKVPGTNISWPVVIGPDNNYYAEKGYDKKYSKNGVLWTDSDTKFGKRSEISKNTVIYGHNWTNVSNNPKITNNNDVMFGQLTSYHHLDFAKKTPYIHYSTEKERMVWQVFAVFYTEDSFNYILSNPKEETFKKIVATAMDKSLHDFDVKVKSTDKIITLSTCTRAYGNRSDQRFVVMAKLVDKNAELKAVGVAANKDFKKPQFK